MLFVLSFLIMGEKDVRIIDYLFASINYFYYEPIQNIKTLAAATLIDETAANVFIMLQTIWELEC